MWSHGWTLQNARSLTDDSERRLCVGAVLDGEWDAEGIL